MNTPRSVRLEAAAVCQLKCPSCSTGMGENAKTLGRGFLKAHKFRAFLEANPEIAAIELSNYGEIFLNPEIGDIMRIAHERGVQVSATNGVNLNTVTEEALEAAVKYQVRHMTISIDGVSQETYSQYRVNGSYERVFSNLKKLIAYKHLHRSELPALKWQFIVFGHNEHELPAARKLAGELGMEFAAKRSWDEKISPIRNIENVKKQTGWRHVTRSEYEQEKQLPYRSAVCNQLWDEPQINWDGRLMGCCVNSWADFGVNVFSESMESAFNSENISYAREMLLGNAPPRANIPCSTCKKYLVMKSTGNFPMRERINDTKLTASNT